MLFGVYIGAAAESSSWSAPVSRFTAWAGLTCGLEHWAMRDGRAVVPALLQHASNRASAPAVTMRDDNIFIRSGCSPHELLDVVQAATEQERVCAALLRELIEQGLLCVIDGAKGLRQAIQTVFGSQAFVRRCQWYTREHSVAYLPKSQRALWRRTLQAAYERSSDTETKAALLRLRSELRLLNDSAVTSLDEGLEETLTLHRLGLFRSLGISLKTTHCIESRLSQVGAYTDKVDRWRNS